MQEVNKKKRIPHKSACTTVRVSSTSRNANELIISLVNTKSRDCEGRFLYTIQFYRQNSSLTLFLKYR